VAHVQSVVVLKREEVFRRKRYCLLLMTEFSVQAQRSALTGRTRFMMVCRPMLSMAVTAQRRPMTKAQPIGIA
jgi:hypothetical protein